MVNTKCSEEKIPAPLQDLFRYIERGVVENPGRDPFIDRIDAMVRQLQENSEVEAIMTMEEYYAHEIAGAREDGWDEGFADGKNQGKAAGEARMSNLTKLLLTAQRADDLLRATEDTAYREKLFKEFGL